MFWLSYLLLFVYAFALLVFIQKNSFFCLHSLSKKQLSILLVLKFIFGFVYIYAHKHVLSGGDIFMYFYDAEIIFKVLKENPWHFIQLVFAPNNVNIANGLKPYIHEMGFWGDTGAYMLVRFNALIRLISFGNIYIHGLFAAFFSFVGSILIAKVFESQLKANILVVLSIFLSPSLLFWTSGIHKEFISVFALGLILYHFFGLSKRFNSPLNILGFTAGLVLFFFTRNYMLLALIPSLLAFSIYKVFHIRFRRAVFLSLLVLIGFLNYTKIPTYNKTGFEVILEKRHQFEDLSQGNTSINLDAIEPNFLSLMKNSPKALFNSLFRPHFLEANSLFLFLAMLENVILAILLVLAFFNFHKLTKKESNLIILMLLYSLFLLLIIGWIVPNIGAILRYRSIALVLLIPSLVFVVAKTKLLHQIEKKRFDTTLP